MASPANVKHYALVQYGTPGAVPKGMRRAAVVAYANEALVPKNMQKVGGSLLQPTDAVPPGLAKIGVVVYATTQASPADMPRWGMLDAADVVAPVITDTAVTETAVATLRTNAGGNALVSWTTDEAADGQVEYSVNSDMSASSLTTRNAALTTAHAETVTGLAADTLYYFRGISRDAALNSTTGATVSLTTIWTPAALGAIVELWYDASLETNASAYSGAGLTSKTEGQADGNPVDWGPDNVAITAGGVNRPVFHVAGANGAPCWSFDGTNHRLTSAGDVDALDLTADKAVLIVFRAPAAAADRLFTHYDVTTNTERWGYTIQATGAIGVFEDTKGSFQNSVLTTFADGANHAALWNRAGTTEVLTADGATLDTFTAMANTAATGAVRIGATGAGAGILTGDILFVLACSDDLTAGQINDVFGYLGSVGLV